MVIAKRAKMTCVSQTRTLPKSATPAHTVSNLLAQTVSALETASVAIIRKNIAHLATAWQKPRSAESASTDTISPMLIKLGTSVTTETNLLSLMSASSTARVLEFTLHVVESHVERAWFAIIQTEIVYMLQSRMSADNARSVMKSLVTLNHHQMPYHVIGRTLQTFISFQITV